MQMESSFVRARELRRYELLDDAARSRLAAGAESGRDKQLTVPFLAALINRVNMALAERAGKKACPSQPSLLGTEPVG